MSNGAIRAHPSNTCLSTSTKVLIELQHLLLMCRTKTADNISRQHQVDDEIKQYLDCRYVSNIYS